MSLVKKTVALMPVYRTIAVEPMECFNRLRDIGMTTGIVHGDACVATTRNIQLSLFVTETKGDYLLMIDDDMVFAPSAAESLLDFCQQEGPSTALYVTVDGRPAVMRREGKLYSGLGFFACPREPLVKLYEESPPIEKGSSTRAMTWTAMDGEDWVKEDERLCRRLGGVKIGPVAVRHLKPQALTPDHRVYTDLFNSGDLRGHR